MKRSAPFGGDMLVRILSGKHRGKVVRYVRPEGQHLSVVSLSRTGPETFFNNQSIVNADASPKIKSGFSFEHTQVDIFDRKRRSYLD